MVKPGNQQSENEPKILMCARCADLKTSVYGAVRSDCADCRNSVWVSQSGQELIRQAAAGSVEVICAQCLGKRMKNEGIESAPMKFAPGAADELERHIKGIGNN